MRLTDLHEARRLANERWISYGAMDIKVREVCFNSMVKVKEFWEFYHDRLIGDTTKDKDDAHKFLSDLGFRRKAHVRAMNKSLESWNADFRVSDMRWTSDDEDADIEWKIME